MVEVVKDMICEEDDGIRLDRWFHRHYKEYPFATISKLARTGQLRINGKRTKASFRLTTGQEIRFPKLIWDDVESSAGKKASNLRNFKAASSHYDISDNVTFINSNIIVINKPAGLAVQGGNGIEISVDQLTEELIFDAKERPRLVHRIDKDTSGLLALARNIKAAQEISNIFQNHQVKKKYLAILQGQLPQTQGRIDACLEKKEHSGGFENMVVSSNGKRAITEYKVLQQNELASLVELIPITGRKHQLRAHAEYLGHPIIGDRKYNKQFTVYKKIVKDLCLHALEMKMPLFGEKLEFHAPIPENFRAAASFFKLTLA